MWGDFTEGRYLREATEFTQNRRPNAPFPTFTDVGPIALYGPQPKKKPTLWGELRQSSIRFCRLPEGLEDFLRQPFLGNALERVFSLHRDGEHIQRIGRVGMPAAEGNRH